MAAAESVVDMTGAGLTFGFKNAISIASSLTASTGAATTASSKPPGTAAGSTAAGPVDDSDPLGNGDAEDDTWGIAKAMRIFNVAETCMRYTDRLGKEINQSGSSVFGKSLGSASNGQHNRAGNAGSASAPTTDADKLKMCCENLESAKITFQQVRGFCWLPRTYWQ